jgi:hypothetical protein
MLFAAWRADGRGSQCIHERVREIVGRCDATRVETEHSTLAAKRPTLLRETGAAVAGSTGSPVYHPSVELTASGALQLDAGMLPQYPLYYARGPGGEYLLACS